MRGRSGRPRMRGLGCHSVASVGAPAARRNALLHSIEPFAARCTCPTDLGALTADMLMVGGLACHKVDRDRANLCAIEHDLEVLGRGVLSAHLEAVVHRHMETSHVTFVAGVHARLHVRVDLVHRSFSV